jgi:hypothetical protein
MNHPLPACPRILPICLLECFRLCIWLIVGASLSVQAISREANDGTAAMVARLAELDRTANPSTNPYLNSRRADQLRARLRPDLPIAELAPLRYQLGLNLLQANDNAAAITEFRYVLEIIASSGQDTAAQARVSSEIEKLLALTWLRFGEQENCVAHHSPDSCLFPIKGDGVHRLRRGSEEAFTLYLQMLRANPADLRARWLLNVAAMTLGRFPDGVPSDFRLPPAAFASAQPLPAFRDIASDAGANVMGNSGGCALADFDGDGWLDLVVTSLALTDNARFLRNRGDGTFEDRTAIAGLTGITGGLNLTTADYNNDGHQDVLVLRGGWMGYDGRHPNSLLRNNGDGTFSDVTEAAGILSFHPTQTATWLDFDGDGWLDVFIGNESVDKEVHPCELFRNNRDGTFTEMAEAVGVAGIGFVKGVTNGDYNNDGRPDLYVSVLGGENHLLRNAGPQPGGGWRFTDVTRAAGVAEPIQSFGCWFWDYDNDGWEDLLVLGFAMGDVGNVAAAYLGQPFHNISPRLYRNNRRGGFDDVSATAGLEQCWVPMGANFGDVDNDGWLDFYVGTGSPPMEMILPNKMYRNKAGRGFQDVTTAGNVGHLQKGHAVAFGDYDHDGDQDIYLVVGGAFSGDRSPNVLFQNPGTPGNSWLKLWLTGVISNRQAFGARVRVVLRTPTGARELHRTVTTGGSFGCNPLSLELGLGDATAIERVEIHWPVTGRTQVLTDFALNRAYAITENATVARPLPLPALRPVSEPAAKAHHHHH